jgi:hypothetical protein
MKPSESVFNIGDIVYTLGKKNISFYEIKEIIETQKCLNYKMTNNYIFCGCQLYKTFEDALKKYDEVRYGNCRKEKRK